jgi:hypothetical protein
MNAPFQVGQRVRIKRGVRPHGGKLGTVVEIDHGYWIDLDLMRNVRLPHVKRYGADELEPVKARGLAS